MAGLTAENAEEPEIRTQVPLKIGDGHSALFTTFHGLSDPGEHIALVFGGGGNVRENGNGVPLVRLHSECLTGDVFGSGHCDCGAQLREAVDLMAAQGGVILYLRQEGRGIGLYRKLDAYRLQKDLGLDTYDANLALGRGEDERDYAMAAQMLRALGIGRIRLLSNNPGKAAQLRRDGIEVAEMIPTGVHAGDGNRAYLETKKNKGGHRIGAFPASLSVLRPGGPS